MNNTKKIALAIAVLCSAGSAMAQDAMQADINPSWYIAPTVVRIKPDHDFLVPDTGWGGGLRFGKAVHPLWDIQFGVTDARSDRSDALGHYDYRQTLVGVDALLMLSRKSIRPFLLAGIGAERDHESNWLRGNVSDWSPYASLGAGLQFAFNERWSAQLDARMVRAHLSNQSRFGFPDNKTLTKYVGFSLNYAFNPPPSAPMPAPAPKEVVVAQAEPAPAPVAPPPPPPPPPARFEKVTLSATELFAFDKATLTMPQPKLDDIAAALQAAPSVTDVDIVGYTDRLGSTKYNQKLSERRANAVRDYLISKGVDAGRLKAYGKGEQNPVVTDCHQKKRPALIACLAPNRRVEVEQITVERRVQ